MGIDYSKITKVKVEEIANKVSSVDIIVEYHEILLTISNALKEYRKENNLTQNELAKMLNESQAMISKLEAGKYNPTIKMMYDISRKLGDSSKWFVKILEKIAENLRALYTNNYDSTYTLNLKSYSNVICFEKYRENERGGYNGKYNGSNAVGY